MQNLEPAKQELKKPVTGDENDFLKSLKSPQVNQRSVEELTDVLKYVMVKVGLRQQNWPHEIEKAVLLEHIVNNFGGHTHEEIKLAFDMAINDKLEVDANCFENFSCAYFSKIMNAYRVWAAQTHKTIVKDTPMLPTTKEDISDDGMDAFWDSTENLVKTTNYPIDLIPPMLYDWMDKNGNILLNTEDKKKYFERATLTRHSTIAQEYEKNPFSLEAKAKLTDFNKMREEKKYSVSENEILKNLSKKMVVYDMMKAL